MQVTINGRTYRHQSELVDAIRELVAEQEGNVRDGDARELWNQLNEALDNMRAEERRLRDLAGNANGAEDQVYAWRSPHSAHPGTAVRDRALRAVERNRDALSAEAGDRLDVLLRRRDETGLDARYIAAVAEPAYNTAFGKMLMHGSMAPLRFTSEEQAAVQEVNSAEEMRTTLQVGSGAAGGFAVPFTLDPTIVLTSAGAQCAVRNFARVETISTDQWKGVSSAGVTAAFAAELTEASDNAPVLAQPTADSAKAQAFIPYSIEIGQDWGALEREMGKLLADAKDTLEATEFLTGNGVDRPLGIISGATTTLSGLSTTFAVADIYALMQAVPARFQDRMAVAANPITFDNAYRLVGGGSTEPPVLPTREGPILGRRKFEWSTMATYPTATARIMIAGDWSYFLIADRVGMTIELVPHLFGASNRFPIGARGLYAYWRTATTVLSANAFRVLIRPS